MPQVLSVLGLAIQVSALTASPNSVSATGSGTASKIYSTCYKLLEISSRQPALLNLSVSVLAAVHEILSTTLQQRDFFGKNERIKQILHLLLISVLEVMNETLACIQESASDGLPGMDAFQWSIGKTQDLRDQLIDEVWACRLPSDSLSSQHPLGKISRMHDWLRPSDPTVRAIYETLWTAKALRVEFTCEWFSKPLLEFVRSSDTVFWIEGPPGYGKGTLYNWIVDSLQNQVGGKDYIVLNHSVNPFLLSELNMPSLLKALLQKAFEQHAGLTCLHDTLAKAFDKAAESDSLSDVTEALWTVLDTALKESNRPSIVIIDSLNELDGSSAAAGKFIQRLYRSLSERPKNKMLLISQPFDQPLGIDPRRFILQRSHLNEDIRRVVEGAIALEFRDGRSELVDWIISRANGNLLWGILVVQISKLEYGSSIPTPVRTLPTSLDAAVSKLISKINFDDPMVRLLLFSSLVAARPLRVDEAQSLLNLDITSRAFTRQETELTKVVDQGCGLIMVVDSGIIRFRHSLFRQYLQEIAETKWKQSLEDIHVSMTTRLLLYLRLVVTTRSELTLKPIASSILEELLHSHQLMTYALRYWTWHYGRSGLADDTRPLGTDGILGPVFPDSTFVAALEATYWSNGNLYETVQHLKIAAQARQQVLGNCPALLQTTSALGMRYKSAKNSLEAAINFALAFRFAQELLPDLHEFTTKCVIECLDSVQSLPVGTGPDLPVTLPDLLQYLIAKYNKQLGPGNDQALECSRSLARHYADTDQFGLSTRVYRDIYRLTADRFGRSSFQAKAAAADVAAFVQRSGNSRDQSQDDDSVYEKAIHTFDVTDGRYVKAAIKRAEMYRSQNDSLNAELEYLNLMHGIHECCHLESDRKQEEVTQVGLIYAGYLTEQDQINEAQSILLGLWTRFEDQQVADSAGIDLLKDVALGLKQVGLPAVALKVLNRIAELSDPSASYHDDLQIDEEAFTNTALELVHHVQSGSVLPKSTEDALMQTVESAKSQESSTTNTLLIRVSRTLIDSFVLEKRWQDVVYVASSALDVLWPAVLNNSGEQPLPGDFDLDLGNIAIDLAQAHSMLDADSAASDIYWFVLSSVKVSDLKHSPFFASVAQAALDVSKKTGHPTNMINATRELVNYYQATLGEHDPLTIDSSYTLAALCMEHGEINTAKRQYEKIAATLQTPDYHDRQAIPALQALLVIFRSKKAWDQAANVYNSLWRTFLVKGKEYRIRDSTAKTLYQEYSRLLESQICAEPGSIHQIREEYRDGCVSSFGEHSPITLEATLCLAKSWEQKDSNSPEAIRLYESIIDGQRDRIQSMEHDNAEIQDQVEAILRRYYRTHLDDDLDQATIRRAIMLQTKQYLKDESSADPWAPNRLSTLALLVSFLTKEGSLQSRNHATEKLRQGIDSVLLSECEGKALVDAATTLASVYIEGRFIEQGLDPIQALREKFIFHETGLPDSDGLEDLKSSDRPKLAFLTAFETRVGGSMEAFAEVHSRALLEMALWDSFQALKDSSSPCEQILSRGASLYELLKSHYPSYQGEILQQQLFSIFMGTYGPAFRSGAQTPKKFCEVLLGALSKERNEVDLLHLSCVALKEEAQRLADQEEYPQLLEVSVPGFDFVRHLGAYGSNTEFENGLQLGLILAGADHGLPSDQAVRQQMIELGKLVLREILQLCRTKDLDLERVSIEELSKVADVLGRQQNYHDLEVESRPFRILLFTG